MMGTKVQNQKKQTMNEGTENVSRHYCKQTRSSFTNSQRVYFSWSSLVLNDHFVKRTISGGGGTPYNGLYGEAPLERGIL